MSRTQAHELSMTQAGQAMRDKELSPVELFDSYCRRIEMVEPEVRAFSQLTIEMGREAALASEERFLRGTPLTPLDGLPVAVKDLFDVESLATRAGSAVPALPAGRDSFCVDRLKSSGAVLMGKTHTHEFAYGVLTPSSRNPWDTSRTPGGSSGGSAAAVSARECLLALGTDTGGSVQIPAALCGVTGMKPTYGRVSRDGVFPLSWSLDNVGTLTRDIAGAALGLQALAGFDPADRATLNVPVPDYLRDIHAGVKGLVIGVPTNYYTSQVSADITDAVHTVVEMLRGEGAIIREVTVPMTEFLAAVIDGLCIPEAYVLHEQRLRDHGDVYDPEIRAVIGSGQYVPAPWYIKAMQARTQITERWHSMFEGLDVLIAPTAPIVAPVRDTLTHVWPDGTAEPVIDMLARLAIPANVTGFPAVSLFGGLDPTGLPIGIQIMGKPFDEKTVLRVGQSCEEAVYSLGYRQL